MRKRELEHDPLESRPRRRRVWTTIGFAAAMLAVVYFAGWLITGSRFSSELARLKAQGEPVEPSDLLPKLRPGEPNAADVYEQASALAPTPALLQLYANGTWQWNPADLPVARSIVNGNPEYYQLLEDASRLPTCLFPAGTDEVGMAQISGTVAMERDGALEALLVKLQVQAHDGDLDGALATCATLLRVVRHLEQGGGAGGRDGASYAQNLTFGHLGQALSCGDPSPAACRRLADLLAAPDYHALLVKALQVDRVAVLARMQWMERGQWFVHQRPRSARWVVREAYPVVAKPMWNDDKARYLQMMASYLEVAKRPWPKMRAEVTRLDKQFSRAFRRPGSPISLSGGGQSVFFGLTGRDVATAGAWQVALALKTYHHDHGAYPATLAEVEKNGWRPPKDPFSGKPYRYRRDARGFTVWSVGFDGKDNNARPAPDEPWDLMNPGYDFVARCTQ